MHHPDFVHREAAHGLGVEGIHIHAVFDRFDARRNHLRGVLDQIVPGGVERLRIEPDHGGFDGAGGHRLGTAADHVAAADVDLVSQRQSHRHGSVRYFKIALPSHNALDARAAA